MPDRAAVCVAALSPVLEEQQKERRELRAKSLPATGTAEMKRVGCCCLSAPGGAAVSCTGRRDAVLSELVRPAHAAQASDGQTGCKPSCVATDKRGKGEGEREGPLLNCTARQGLAGLVVSGADGSGVLRCCVVRLG